MAALIEDFLFISLMAIGYLANADFFRLLVLTIIKILSKNGVGMAATFREWRLSKFPKKHAN